MMMMFPIMEAVRSGGNLENIGGDSKYSSIKNKKRRERNESKKIK